MNLVDGLKAAISVSLHFSWIALLIALLPTLFVTFAVETRRLQYAIAGLLGGVAGGFCGATSLFLSFWFGCQGQVQSCNTAQGDMGLLVTFPAGSLAGCLIALAWTRLTLGIPKLGLCDCDSTRVLGRNDNPVSTIDGLNLNRPVVQCLLVAYSETATLLAPEPPGTL